MTIREPRQSEAPVCRMLLPETHLDPRSREFRLAIDESTGKIAGALSFRDSGAALSGIRVHVVPAKRRAGFGSGLLAYAMELARQRGLSKLGVGADIKNECGAEAFLMASGFQEVSRLSMVEGEIGQLRASLEAARKKIPAGEELPAEARFVGIDEAPMAELVRLHAEHIAHIPAVPGLQRAFKLESFRESLILLIDGKIAGAILASVSEQILSVPAWIVTPEFRGKHIGVLLRVALVDRVIDRVKRVRFEYLESAGATKKLRQDAGYPIVRILAQFERSV